jgi:hypothetical protein
MWHIYNHQWGNLNVHISSWEVVHDFGVVLRLYATEMHRVLKGIGERVRERGQSEAVYGSVG